MTGRELVAACLRQIGAIAPGETPAAQEASDALATINRMISSWSTEPLTIYASVRESPFTLTATDATVTMGSSGDLTNRAIRIVAASIQDASTGAETPVRILTEAEYAALPDKTTATAEKPWALRDDGGFPQRTLTLYPIPSAAHKLVVHTLRPLTEISTLDTSLSLPPGYERALVFNGAIDLAPEYGRTADALLMKNAIDSKAAIKVGNARVEALTPDPVPASGGGGGGSYDIHSGGFR